MAKYPQCSRHASTFICVLDFTRALESFTSRFVSLAALKGTAGLVFGLPTGRHFSWGGDSWPNNTALQQELVVWACWAQGPKAIESAPRKVPDEAPETSKIDLRRVQNRAPPKWPRRTKPLGDRSAPDGRQDRSELVSGQLSERSWQLLGPSRSAPSAS